MSERTMHGEPAATNVLIASLPEKESTRIWEHVTREDLPIGHKLFGQDQRLEYVHFPVSCVLSLVTTLRNGTTIEFSTIGNEGSTGVPIFLGPRSLANASGICQVPGEALVMEADAFAGMLDELPSLRRVMGLYTHSLLVQVGQAVACNRLHTTQERTARWLLTTHDRVGRDEFVLTHEFLSFMLGVRRASVSVAARILQQAGLIEYKRGKIRITDRAGLEDASCECYGVMSEAHQNILSMMRD